MHSHSHVQHVWDSFVIHLKSLSESLQIAHDVFSHPEEEVKARLLCTFVRRKRPLWDATGLLKLPQLLSRLSALL